MENLPNWTKWTGGILGIIALIALGYFFNEIINNKTVVQGKDILIRHGYPVSFDENGAPYDPRSFILRPRPSISLEEMRQLIQIKVEGRFDIKFIPCDSLYIITSSDPAVINGVKDEVIDEGTIDGSNNYYTFAPPLECESNFDYNQNCSPQNITTESRNPAVKIAHIDTGVDFSKITNLVAGNNFVTGANMPCDDQMHGTSVAGIITEELEALQEDGPIDYEILTIKGFDSLGVSTLYETLESICDAYQQGADFINASWSFELLDSTGQSYLKRVIASYDQFSEEPIYIIAAAGNKDEDNNAHQHFPASFGYQKDDNGNTNEDYLLNVIPVTSVEKHSGDTILSPFSKFSYTNTNYVATGCRPGLIPDYVHCKWHPLDNLNPFNDKVCVKGTSFAVPETTAYLAYQKATGADISNTLNNLSEFQLTVNNQVVQFKYLGNR